MKPALIAVALTLVLAGCAAHEDQHEAAPEFDRRIALRTAVLPFVDQAEGDSLPALVWTAGLDIAPLLADERYESERAAAVFRLKLFARLQHSNLELLPLRVVDRGLATHGVDLAAVYRAEDREAEARRLARLLGVDAVLFGQVTDWDRDYYLIESQNTVGFAVELREGVRGGLLFRGEQREGKSAGISKLPLSNSLEGFAMSTLGQPIKGMSRTRFARLSDDVSWRMAARLAASGQPEGAKPLRLDWVGVVAASPTPESAPRLLLVAEGSPDCLARLEVGRGHEVPLFESQPGVYQGWLPPTREAETLWVRLIGRDLARVSMRLEPELAPK